MAKKTFPGEQEEIPVTPRRPEIERPGEPGNPNIPDEDPHREPAEMPPGTPPSTPPQPEPMRPGII